MLNVLKRKNPYQQAARAVYGTALLETRKLVFYEEYDVPDSFTGRFDLLVLLVFLILQRMLEEHVGQAEEFNQALFDEMFFDMDQTLREMGIGDMGVPKHMRKMMKAFNGRMHAYQMALQHNDMQAALAKNLYGTAADVPPESLAKMEQKVHGILAILRQQSVEDILHGRVFF